MGRRVRSLCYAVLAALLLGLIGLGGWAALDSYRVGSHLRQAQEALEKDHLDDARAHLAQVLKSRPSNAQAHFLASRAARKAGDAQEAAAHLERSRELGWPTEAVELEAVLLEVQRDPRESEGRLLEAIGRDHPDSRLMLEALSRGYINLLSLDRALFCLDRWLEKDPHAVRALSWRGDVYDRLGRSEEALQDFQLAVDIDPGHDEARTRLAKLLLKDRKLQEAAAQFEVVQQHRPDDLEVLRGLARCRQDQDRREEAEQLLDTALTLHPDDAEALNQRGCLALDAGRLEEAEGFLRRAVKAAPFERELLFNFSRCLHGLRKDQEAKQWEDRLARVETDLRQVKKTMSQVLASPEDPNPRCELGVIFLRNSQEKEGLRWLNSALRCDPRHRPTHQALADHFEKQGQADLAAQHRRLAQ